MNQLDSLAHSAPRCRDVVEPLLGSFREADLKTDAAAQLLVLARPPRRDLFPFLHRAEAMAPLIVLLALIPVLIASSWQQMDAQDAVWGLRALTVAQSKSVDSVLLAKMPDESSAVGQSTPLGMWLAASALLIIDPSVLVRLFVPSYLATFALLIALCGMLRAQCGARLGLIAALLLAFHLPVLTMAQDTTPIALSLLFAVIAFWGITSHLSTSQEIVSLSLLWGGIGLGLCLLTSMPMAALVLATTLIWIVLQPVFRLLRGSESSRTIPRLRQGLLSVVSVLVFCVTALAVGGWWELLVYSRGDDVSWWRWDAGLPAAAPIGAAVDGFPHLIALAGSAVSSSICLLQALIGLSVVGLACLGQSIFSNDPQSSKSRHRNAVPHRENADLGANHLTSEPHGTSAADSGSVHFLFVWLTVGLAARLWCNRQGHLAPELQQLGTAYVMLPAVGIAAHGLDQIARRRVRGFVSFLAIFGTVLLLLIAPVSAQIDDLVLCQDQRLGWPIVVGQASRLQRATETVAPQFTVTRSFSCDKTLGWSVIVGLTVVAVVAVVLGAWWAGRYCRTREPLERRALATCLALLVIGNSAIGIHSVGAVATRQHMRTPAQDRMNLTHWHAILHQCRQPMPRIPLRNLSQLIALLDGVQPIKQYTLVSNRKDSRVLEFVLRSLWPDAEFRTAKQIELPRTVAVKDSGAGGKKPIGPDQPLQVVVFWGQDLSEEQQWNSLTLSNPTIEKLGSPMVFQQQLLSCFAISMPQSR